MGVGFIADLVEATERLIAAIAALLLTDTSFVRSCFLTFTLEAVMAAGFDGVLIAEALQAWSDGNRCWGQNCWLHFLGGDKENGLTGQTKATHIATDGSKQQFLASQVGAVGLSRFLGPPGHD